MASAILAVNPHRRAAARWRIWLARLC